jgi:hypothetical protein
MNVVHRNLCWGFLDRRSREANVCDSFSSGRRGSGAPRRPWPRARSGRAAKLDARAWVGGGVGRSRRTRGRGPRSPTLRRRRSGGGSAE